MHGNCRTRRAFTLSLLGTVLLPKLGAIDSYEKTVWFEKKEGNDKPISQEGVLRLDREDKRILFSMEHTIRLEIPVASVTNLVYERAKRPRYAAGLLLAWPLLFTKTKKHFLTIQYKDESAEGQYALFQLHKSNYREVLASVEAAAGVKMTRLEDN